MTQKFFKGDLVQVGEMPVYMSHFTGNCQAIVIGSYTEQCSKSKDSDKQYTLHLLNGHETSWYEENQLTLIEPDRLDLLPKRNVHRIVWEAKTARDDSLG